MAGTAAVGVEVLIKELALFFDPSEYVQANPSSQPN